MSRLPQIGSDDGTWGSILNDFLSQSLASDGKLKTDSVSASQILDGSITESELASNSVTNTKILDGAVTNSKLAPDTIQSTVIANNAITNTKIIDGAVTNSKLANNSITNTKILDGSITNSKLVDATITESKLDPSLAATINATPPVTSVNTKTGAIVLDKTDINLSNVDNTSDTNKPISSATQTALDAKSATIHTHTAANISDSTAIGQSLITATDAAAARTAIGVNLLSISLEYYTLVPLQP